MGGKGFGHRWSEILLLVCSFSGCKVREFYERETPCRVSGRQISSPGHSIALCLLCGIRRVGQDPIRRVCRGKKRAIEDSSIPPSKGDGGESRTSLWVKSKMHHICFLISFQYIPGFYIPVNCCANLVCHQFSDPRPLR